jgi:hypothetical protein
MNAEASVVLKIAKNKLYALALEYGVLFPLLLLNFVPVTREERVFLY